jgi:hypothetical protein
MQPFEFTYKGVNVEVGSDFIRFRGASAGKKGVEIEEELMEMLGHRISLRVSAGLTHRACYGVLVK